MNNFGLQAGVKLQLQFADNLDRGRFHVAVIGYVEGRSLMISAPQTNGNLLLLREGERLIVRLLSGKQVIGFNSEITKIYNNPFSYVHLKPPEEVEQLNVRNAHRVELDIIASIYPVKLDENGEKIKSKGDKAIAARINNISTTGCQVQLLQPLPESSSELMINTKIIVVEQERLLSLDAVIRSHREVVSEDKTWHLYGLEFSEMDDDRRLLLNCFVYEKLVKDFYNEK